MSEFNQVDLQIGTEEQFETKKSSLSEGVIVGLTDLIHESELDSDVQTKLNAGASIYKHTVFVPCLLEPNLQIEEGVYTLSVTIISSSSTAYTFDTFCAELASGSDKTISPYFAYTPSTNTSFNTGAVFVYKIFAIYKNEAYNLTAKALLFEDFDGASTPERTLKGYAEINTETGSETFHDTITQL